MGSLYIPASFSLGKAYIFLEPTFYSLEVEVSFLCDELGVDPGIVGIYLRTV